VPPTGKLRDQLQAALAETYVIERELDRGGMSRVFVARDASLNREIVIKVLAPELAGSVSGGRFRREIELAARLQHSNIVPLLSAGEVYGLPYYTMPFVAGESLRARLSHSGELPIEEALPLLRDLARALAYAHSRGIVHRDIKPENVLLAQSSALVTDFGVAKAFNDAITLDGVLSPLTSTGVALGTPAYMAPEQSAADPAADHRVDIYAFGVVAYEMLTGTPPFVARNPQAVIAAHATEAPTPLPARRPATPPVLAGVVMRCLAKRPADRPRSAEELVRVLDGLVAGAADPAADSASTGSSPRGKPRLVRWLAAVGAIRVIVG
jgi:serine/threonine-protein kinase